MNIKKVIAAGLAVIVVASTAVYPPVVINENGIVAEASATEVFSNGITYNVYPDHAEVIQGPDDYISVSIPDSVMGIH